MSSSTGTSGLLCALVLFVAAGSPRTARAQAHYDPFTDEVLTIGAEYGQCLRMPKVESSAGRIGSRTINDGYMGLMASYRIGQQEISAGWLRHQNSIAYAITDAPYGTSRFKNTSNVLAYTRVPVRIGIHLLRPDRPISLMPYLSIAWISVDNTRSFNGNGSSGVSIDQALGDTVTTSSHYTVTLVQKNTALYGIGATLAGRLGRWSLQLNAEWLTGKDDWSVIDVTYDRTSAVDGSVQDRARIRSKTANLGMGLTLRFQINGRGISRKKADPDRNAGGTSRST